MKLSSVSLVTTTLAAIAGTTNASGPPHEHWQGGHPTYSGAPARYGPAHEHWHGHPAYSGAPARHGPPHEHLQGGYPAYSGAPAHHGSPHEHWQGHLADSGAPAHHGPPHEHLQGGHPADSARHGPSSPAYGGVPTHHGPPPARGPARGTNIDPARLDAPIAAGKSAADAWEDAAEKAERLHFATMNRRYHEKALQYKRKQTKHSESVTIHRLDQQHLLQGGRASSLQENRIDKSGRTEGRAKESKRLAQKINAELDSDLLYHDIDFEAERAAQRLLSLDPTVQSTG